MQKPFMVAVSGGSGSGKTTFVKEFIQRITHLEPLVISLDDYYRDLSHLSIEERAKSNFDDPIAIERDLIHEHISLLRNGIAVNRPCYDFANHTRSDRTETIYPSKVIVLEGIFSLCYTELYKLIDLKVFIDVDDDIRVVRRIGRDMSERGRDFEGCASQYLGSVKAMHQKHIEPTKKHADFIVPWHNFNLHAVNYISSIISEGVRKNQEVFMPNT